MFKLWFLFLFLLFARNGQAMESYADLVEEVMPTVVNIFTQKEAISSTEDVDNVMLNPNFEARESLGSGFFIRNDGHILTNYHVIKDAKDIFVMTNDEQIHRAKIIGTDQVSDLVVLKIDAPKDRNIHFNSVRFGRPSDVRVGDRVLTFGNPYGLGISVSEGIISAKSRYIGNDTQQYFQTDAAINQGNSGGPMFNTEGEVIGVNTAVYSGIGATGIGFSLPSDIANWVSSQLIDDGVVHRAWIGVDVANGIDQYTGKSGFVITEISEESNAYKEGVRVGDIILKYNDNHAGDINAFRSFVETMSPGQKLRLTTSTLGEEVRSVITVQEMPVQALQKLTNKALREHHKYIHQSEDKDTVYISELKIAVKEAQPRGLMIVKLERKSPLYGKGIKEGDIILEADREDVYSPENLLDNIRYAAGDDFRPISLLIQSVDNSFYATIEVGPEND